MAEHAVHLEMVFRKLQEHGLTINEEKCVFGATSIDYLGHTIDAKGIRPNGDKVKAIANFQRPEIVSELRRFPNMINYYRQFIPHDAESQGPVHRFIPGNKN